jgi:cell division protein FtsW (lipid II flippase)
LLGLFVVFVVMFMAGVNQWICIVFGVSAALALVYGTFNLNKKYGEHGLMKAQSRRNHPRFVINRRLIPLLFKRF